MKRKIAVLSDVHGNVTALKAVLNDANSKNVNEYWTLGDIAFGGSSSEECYQLLSEVNTTQYLMGNWETAYNSVILNRKIDINNPSEIYFIMLVRYDQSMFSAGRTKQLATLKMTGHKIINNITFSLTHNLPNTNRGHSLFPDKKQTNFDELISDLDTDVGIYAHTHTPVWRYTSAGQIILNPGSVGQPWYSREKFMGNRNASYLLISLSNNKITDLDFRSIPYDIKEELTHAEKLGFPYPGLYKKLLETGYPSTHDIKELDKINQKFDYTALAKKFLFKIQH